MSSTPNSTDPTPTNTANPADLVIPANPGIAANAVIPANQVNPAVPDPTPEPAGGVPGSGANINIDLTPGNHRVGNFGTVVL